MPPILSKYVDADEIADWESLPDLALGLQWNKLVKGKGHPLAALFYSQIRVVKTLEDYLTYGPAFKRSSRRRIDIGASTAVPPPSPRP